jgi:hypothetical protein
MDQPFIFSKKTELLTSGHFNLPALGSNFLVCYIFFQAKTSEDRNELQDLVAVCHGWQSGMGAGQPGGNRGKTGGRRRRPEIPGSDSNGCDGCASAYAQRLLPRAERRFHG